MNNTGIAMNATGISIPENIKSRFAKGHMAGNESELVFLPQEYKLQVRCTLQLMITKICFELILD